MYCPWGCLCRLVAILVLEPDSPLETLEDGAETLRHYRCLRCPRSVKHCAGSRMAAILDGKRMRKEDFSSARRLQKYSVTDQTFGGRQTSRLERRKAEDGGQ